jgi:hypothetical protein
MANPPKGPCPKSPNGQHRESPEIRQETPDRVFIHTECLYCGATLRRRFEPKRK